jgi:hypothetical protein
VAIPFEALSDEQEPVAFEHTGHHDDGAIHTIREDGKRAVELSIQIVQRLRHALFFPGFCRGAAPRLPGYSLDRAWKESEEGLLHDRDRPGDHPLPR